MNEYFLLVIKYIENKVDDKELQEHLKRLSSNIYDYNEKLLNARISKTLNENNDFKLSTSYFCKLHNILFTNILEEAGSYRNVNISKKEDCINNHSVLYTPYYAIKKTLEYDFKNERNKNYLKNNNDDMYQSMLNFTSNIWQCHPFYNRNTRSCAIFLQKYLISKGIVLSNTSFKNNSLYFRNALIRSNYSTNKNIEPTYEYLDKFLYSIMENPDVILDVNETYVIKQKRITRQ